MTGSPNCGDDACICHLTPIPAWFDHDEYRATYALLAGAEFARHGLPLRVLPLDRGPVEFRAT